MTMAGFDHIQDVLGQLPILKTYTHILLCFPLADSARQSVLKDLQMAVRKVMEQFPFLAGKVVNEGKGPGCSGIFKVARHEPWESSSHEYVRFIDRSTVCASYKEILAAKGPTSMLPGHLLGSRKSFPEQYQETEDDPAPVLDIQANMIRGGLLLDIAAQHNIVDATGMFQIVNLIAIAMRGEQIPVAMILEGNRDRRTLIPLLGPDEPLLDHNDNMPSIPVPSPPPREVLLAFRWCFFTLSRESTARIMEEAVSRPADFVPSMDKVSMNDAITAFIWKHITRIRLKRLGTPDAISKLNRAVDYRRVMNVSPAYMAHMVRLAMLRMSFQEIVSSSLSRLASLVRKSVHDISTEYALRSYATFIANERDKSKIDYGGGLDCASDLSCSSIAHIKLPHFGALGTPNMLRKPLHGPLPCSVYITSTEDGGHEAFMCLHDHDFKLLREDPEWTTYVECVL